MRGADSCRGPICAGGRFVQGADLCRGGLIRAGGRFVRGADSCGEPIWYRWAVTVPEAIEPPDSKRCLKIQFLGTFVEILLSFHYNWHV